MEVVNDKENKSMTNPKENLWIFTNTLPSHSTNLNEPKTPNNIAPDEMCVEATNVMSLIEFEPRLEPCIISDSRETIDAPDESLYIIAKIKGNLSRGVLIDPVCIVNVITKEHLYTQQFNQDTYDSSYVMIKVHDDFIFPTISSITLPIEVGTTFLDATFTIIPTSNQFHVKLKHQWLHSIKVVPSTIHKFLKFPRDGCIITIIIFIGP